jgi:hypothetical protein
MHPPPFPASHGTTFHVARTAAITPTLARLPTDFIIRKSETVHCAGLSEPSRFTCVGLATTDFRFRDQAIARSRPS